MSIRIWFVLLTITLLSANFANAAIEYRYQYCIEHGGRNDGRATRELCVFPDSSECQLDDFVKGACEPGKVFLDLPDLAFVRKAVGWVVDTKNFVAETDPDGGRDDFP